MEDAAAPEQASDMDLSFQRQDQGTQTGPGCGRAWLTAAGLLLITFLAYLPAILHGGFIWDDDKYVTGNLTLRSAAGLRAIWSGSGLTGGEALQHYPLTFTVFWLEYRFFQLYAAGYHLLNVLLHALNAILVWRIMLRLRVPAAALAAALFAVHPVCVESVAWITELKNVLSGAGYLGALLCWLRFGGVPDETPGTAAPGRRAWTFYSISLFLFLCALASKTVTATLPAAMLLIVWWKSGRITLKDLLPMLPMLIVGAGAGLWTAHLEKFQVGASGPEWAMTPVEHILLSGRIVWFYLGKLVWPAGLMFIYPRWTLDQADWRQYLFPLAVLAALTALWLARRKAGRGPLAAALFFTGTLFPVLGFLNVYPMRYSYVADHFQYLACIGPIALFAAAWARIQPRFRGPRGRNAAMSVAAVLLLTLGLLTWRRAGVYRSADSIWQDTLEKDPACWMAHNNLGISLDDQGRLDDAIVHYRETVRLKPDSAEAHNNWGIALERQGKLDEAVSHFRDALRLRPSYPEAHISWGIALYQHGRNQEAASHLREALRLDPSNAQAHYTFGILLSGLGRADEAIGHYLKAVELRPDYPEAHYSLGSSLSALGRTEEAAAHYREAVRLRPDYAKARNNLGVILAARGRTAEAAAEFLEAIRVKPDYAEANNNYGLALLEQGRTQEAIQHFAQAARVKPDYAEAHDNWGVALGRLGRIEEAVVHFREAVRLDPQCAQAHYYLGLILPGQGRGAEGAAHYREALRLKPDLGNAGR